MESVPPDVLRAAVVNGVLREEAAHRGPRLHCWAELVCMLMEAQACGSTKAWQALHLPLGTTSALQNRPGLSFTADVTGGDRLGSVHTVSAGWRVSADEAKLSMDHAIAVVVGRGKPRAAVANSGRCWGTSTTTSGRLSGSTHPSVQDPIAQAWCVYRDIQVANDAVAREHRVAGGNLIGLAQICDIDAATTKDDGRVPRARRHKALAPKQSPLESMAGVRVASCASRHTSTPLALE